MDVGRNNAKATVEAFERVIELEKENTELRKKLLEYEERDALFFKEQMKTMGETLSVLAR